MQWKPLPTSLATVPPATVGLPLTLGKAYTERKTSVSNCDQHVRNWMQREGERQKGGDATRTSVWQAGVSEQRQGHIHDTQKQRAIQRKSARGKGRDWICRGQQLESAGVTSRPVPYSCWLGGSALALLPAAERAGLAGITAANDEGCRDPFLICCRVSVTRRSAGSNALRRYLSSGLRHRTDISMNVRAHVEVVGLVQLTSGHRTDNSMNVCSVS